MRGFNPHVARQVPAQNFADGGIVRGLKRAFGMDEERNARVAAYRAREAQEKQAAAQATQPAPAPAGVQPRGLRGYAAGSALERRMKEVDGYKNGGPVRGPGTGTSDDVPDQVPEGTYIMPTDSTQAIGEQQLAGMGGESVPVSLSNGEFKLLPEQVHAIGVQALDQMKNATHTPVAARGFAPGAYKMKDAAHTPVAARGFAPGARQAQQPAEPPMFFADGGEVEKESSARVASVPAQFGERGNNTFGAPMPGAAPAQPVAATSAPAPAQPSVLQTDPQAAADRAAFGGAWDAAKGVSEDAGRAILDVASMVPRGLAGAYDSAVIRPMRAAGINAGYMSQHLVPDGVDPGSMTPFTDQKRMQQAQPGAAAPVAAPAGATAMTGQQPATTSPSMAGAGRGSVSPAMANPAAPAPEVAPTADQVMPGVFRSGNSYGDSAGAALTGTQPRGLPTAQNMAAAQALSDRGEQQALARGFNPQTRAAGGPGSGPVAQGSFTGGWSGVIGTDPAAGRERKELVSALMTPMKGAQNGQLTAAQRQGMLGLMDQDARATQAQANNQTALQQTEMQGGTQRDIAAMRELGENSRAAARTGIEAGRLGLEKQVHGFDIRSGQRQEKLQERYQAATKSEDRTAIAQEIRDLAGRQDQTNRFTVVPGGQEWDTTANTMRNVPGRVLNNQTGQWVDAGQGGAKPAGIVITNDSAGKAAFAGLPAGATYTGPDGKQYKKN